MNALHPSRVSTSFLSDFDRESGERIWSNRYVNLAGIPTTAQYAPTGPIPFCAENRMRSVIWETLSASCETGRSFAAHTGENPWATHL